MSRWLGVTMCSIFAAALALTLALPANGASAVKVCGSGYGHGVGLSQYGAKGRAEAGQGYGRIVKTYYDGVDLKRYSDNPTVRVLLEDRDLNKSHEVVVSPGREARLRNQATGGTVALGAGTYRIRYLPEEKLYRVTNVSESEAVGAYSGPVLILPVSGGPLEYAGSEYRGGLLALREGSKLHLINRLSMEAYLRGVVPEEMPSSWAGEALKSQAVAARSYARSTRRDGAFDFYDDTRDQVYGGVSAETSSTNRAVRDTARVHAVYDGEPVLAFFHAASGGYIENAANVFGGPRPYLQATRDVDDSGRPYEGEAHAGSPWMSWAGEIDPEGSPQFGVGSIQNIQVLDRAPSGRAEEIRVRGTEGVETISGQQEIRFGLRSTGISRDGGPDRPGGPLPSARISFDGACTSGSEGIKSKIARYSEGRWHLRNTLSAGDNDLTFRYGGTRSGTEPLMGDWNGDGTKTPGIARGNTFYLKNENGGGEADIKFRYGKASDEPVVGDWDGDGRDTVGIVRGNTFYLNNTNTGGEADTKFRYGKAGDEPVVGDWDGDGRDTVGIVRGNTFYLKNENNGGEADIKFRYGKAGDEPVVGDWDGDGRDTVGVVRGRDWYLTNDGGGGGADVRFDYGQAGDSPLVW